MVNCPKCGFEIAAPVKSWPVPLKRQVKGQEAKLAMGIFQCSNCKTRFRAAVEVATKLEDTANIKNMVERIRGIKGELMQTLKNLREKIKTLETERANLMIEIDKLRKVAESRVSALEGEVGMLKEEVKSLRDLLGYTDEPER